MDGIIAESFALQSTGGHDLLLTERDGERQLEERATTNAGRMRNSQPDPGRNTSDDAAWRCRKSENLFMLGPSTGVPKTANGGATGGY